MKILQFSTEKRKQKHFRFFVLFYPFPKEAM